MRSTFFVVLIFGVCAFFAKCKTDDAPQNPCANEHSTSAAFKVEEVYYFIPESDSKYWINYLTDTLANGGTGMFSTVDPLVDSCIWIIGAGVYHEKITKIDFSTQLKTTPSFTLPVTCITFRQPNKMCFPNDDGIDTISRNVFVTNFCNSLVNGKYQGHLSSNPSDTFTVTINTCDIFHKSNTDSVNMVSISNLVRDSIIYAPYSGLTGGGAYEILFQIYDWKQTSTYLPTGNCKLSDKNHIDIIYTLDFRVNTLINDKLFIGTRIP